MSLRPLRLTLASAIVVFAASACTSLTGLDEASSEVNRTDAPPAATEHQGSDSIRAVDNGTFNTEHQGSDS